MTDPIADRTRMIGLDRRRVLGLWKELQDLGHKSWIATGRDAARGYAALRLLVGE
ncbi:MAG: hypothetical protein WA942_18990 [Mycolicibacter sinensis]